MSYLLKKISFDIEISQIISTIMYIIVGIIIYSIIKKIINKSDKKQTKTNNRVKTIKILVLNIIKYIIVIIVIISILNTYGINVTSIVAGLGITTAILGLALQDSAKDFIAGMTIITEGQYEVGDTIEIDGFKGEVEFIGLKTTRIKDYKGATKIIANRYMDNLINYSLHNSLAVVEIGVDYSHKSEEIEKILSNLAKRLNNNLEDVVGEIEVLGITKLDEYSVVYRITVETKPTKQYAVERILRKAIKEELDSKNIKIPIPQMEVYNGK